MLSAVLVPQLRKAQQNKGRLLRLAGGKGRKHTSLGLCGMERPRAIYHPVSSYTKSTSVWGRWAQHKEKGLFFPPHDLEFSFAYGCYEATVDEKHLCAQKPLLLLISRQLLVVTARIGIRLDSQLLWLGPALTVFSWRQNECSKVILRSPHFFSVSLVSLYVRDWEAS